MSTVLFDAYILSTGYKTPSGLPSWFLKADGSIDSTTYLTSASLANVAYKNQANVFTENQILQDSKELILGTGSDFHIVHNGTNTLLDNYRGGLFIRNLGNGGLTYFQNNDSLGATKNTIIIGGATPDVKLHFNGIQKLATTTGGITITGSVTSSSPDAFISTVRGRGYYGATSGNYIQVGVDDGGSSGVLGSATSRGGTLGDSNYRTYWAYDAYYDETLDVWKANRTSLPNKMQAEIGYHTGMFKLRYYGGDVTSTWLDEDWTDIFTVDRGGAGVFLNTLTVLGGNSTNWNTAYGWGDHAGLYSLSNHTHTFASLTSKPTTLSGYGITDAYTKTEIDTGLNIAYKNQANNFSVGQTINGNLSATTGTFTGTVSGADAVGDTDFVTKQQGFIGSGTENYLPKFGIGGKVLGNSLIYDNGTNVGIGTTSPTQKLHVVGNGLFSGSITANGAQINNVDLVVVGAMVSSQGGYATSSTGGYSIDGKTDADVLLAGGGTTPLSSISGSTPVTTKGDIYTYSTTPTRLPVGSDGKVLMASSSTPTGLVWNDPDWGVVYCAEYALSDETTDLAVGTNKLTFRLPFGLTPIDMRISVGTAPTGSNIVVDVNVNGSTRLNTKLSIDAGEKTSVTATSPVDIDISYWQDDYEVTVDIDQVGSSIKGAGLKFKLYYVKGVYYPV